LNARIAALGYDASGFPGKINRVQLTVTERFDCF
jgi:hypothetical protein